MTACTQRYNNVRVLFRRPNSFVIITANRVIHCNTDTPEEMHHWIGLLQKSKGDSRVDGQEFIVRGTHSLRACSCTWRDSAQKKQTCWTFWREGDIKNDEYIKNGKHLLYLFIFSQAGYIKRWSREPKARLWSWRNAGLFSPLTLWTITSRRSAVPPNWELWSSTVSALWCSQMRRSSKTQVSSWFSVLNF